MKLGLAQTIRKRIVIEEIEPRILYSADALAVSQLLVDDTTANNQLVLVLDAENQQSNNATQQPPVGNSSQSETTQTQNTASADNQNTTTEANTEVDSAQQQTLKEIVFVDTRVADYQQLVDDILAKATQGQSIDVVMIRDNEDGLQTILDTLKARGQVDAIHLLGEGANAELTLGNRLLTAEQLAAQSDLFKEIGQHLTADADILIYGCNFAQDATGQAMVQTLANLTGADVAASDDRTGHASENGDWVLEYYSGKIESDVPLSLTTQASWEHALATFTVTTNADYLGAEFVPGTLRYAITQANAVGGTDNIVFNLSTGNETIRLVSALPAINSQIHFSVTNGTQAIISGDTNNNGVADINSGLVFNASGGSSSITGLTIRDFVADGIRLNNAQSIVVTNSVISNNNVGIRITNNSQLGAYTSNTISNNEVGISIDNGYYTKIGGITASLGNVITGNTAAGISIVGGSAYYNSILGNQIYANGGLGIDLNANNTVQINDASDSDAGANQGQNYPIISTVSYNSTTQELTITGHLDSYAGYYFRLEFFGSSAANVDGNGYGEGQQFLGSSLFYNNATGGNFSVTLSGISMAGISAITATATWTESTQTNLYDTSEFSAQYSTDLMISKTTPTVVNTNTVGYQSPPTLQPLNDGRVLYVWFNDALSDNSTNMTLQGRIMNADGTASTNQFQIGTWAVDGSDGYDVPSVSLVKLSDGNVVVGWVRSNGSPGGDEPIFAIINTSVAPTDPGFYVVNQTEAQQNDTTTFESPPVLTALADGRFIATWLKNGLDEDVGYNNLYSRIFNANGTPATGDFQIGTFGVDNFDNFDLPSITVKQLAGGNVVIGFVRSTGFGFDTPVFHVINPSLLPGASGFVVTSDVIVIQNDVTGFESPPVIQTLSDGRFMAAWVRNGSDSSSTGATVWARIFNANGTAATNDFQVGTLPAAGWDLLDNDKVSIAELNNGRVVIAIAKDSSVTDGRIDPYFSIIDTTLTPGTAGFSVVSDVRVNNQIAPSGTYVGAPVVVAMPGNTGNFAVAWSDSYSDGILKVRLYSSAGVALTNEIPVSNSANSLVSGQDSFDVNTIQIAALDNNSIVLGWAGVGDGSLTGAFTSTLQFNAPPVAVNDVANMTETRVPTVYYVDENGDFGTYNVATGAKTLIGNTGLVMLDVAVDKTGLVYATEGINLYKVNPSNAAISLVGSFNFATTVNQLTFDDSGNLYGAIDGLLYSINKLTAQGTVLADYTGMANNRSSGDMTYLNNRLYFTAFNDFGTSAILSYSFTDTSISQLVATPARLWGLSASSDGATLIGTGSDGIRYQTNIASANITAVGPYSGALIYGLASANSIELLTGDVTPGTGGQDYDPNAGDSISVTGVMSGNGTPTFGVGSPINGTYGQLVLNADGTYSYALDSSRPATIAIGGNQVVQEVFSYRITDTSGSHAYATLTINLTGANDAPSGSNSTVTLNEDAFDVLTLADFGFTDADGNSLSGVRITTLPTAGALTLNGVAVTAGQTVSVTDINANRLVFTPVANANGNNYASFTFQVQDNGGTANGGVDLDATPNTITFNVTAVNDAPTISSLGPQVTPTNTALYFNASNANQIIISDLDAAGNLVRVTINTSNGQFTLANLTGLTFTTGDGSADTSMVFTGSLANINNALINAFLNPTTSFSGAAGFTISVDDLGNQGTGGALTASETINVQVGAVTFQQGVNGYSGAQDVRIVTGTPSTNYGTEDRIYQNAGEQVLIRFDQLFGNGPGQIPFGSIITSASLTVNVDNTGSQTSEIYRVLNLTWDQSTATWNSVVNGVQLNDVEASSTALTSVATNRTGYVTYSGLESSLQAWSNGETNNGWVITKSGADWRFASSENATASIRPYLTVSYTLPVPPVVTTSVGTTTHIENTSSTAVDNAITVTDADSTNLSGATIRIANNYVNGQDTLSFVNQSGITGNWNSATGTLTLSGNASVAAYQTALRSIGFSNNSEAPDTLTRTISYTTTDTLGYTSTAVTKSLVITPVNDAPAGADSTVTINEDATHTFTTANFGFTDVDSNTFTAVRISTLPALGALTLNGIAVTAGQSITVADINAGLLVFTPVADGNGTNYSNFTFQVQDNGGTANGGVDLDATPNTITFNVSALNDAPTIGSLGPQFTTINSALYFNTTNGNRILIGDVDASTSSLTVTLSVTQGTFTLASVSGLTFTTGDGTTDANMVFSGNLTNINAALDNAFFTPNNGYTGGASLSVSVNDLGNQGAGGALIATQNLAIQVNSVSYNPITTAPNLVNQNTTFNQSAATPLKLDDGRILYVWIDNALADDVTNMTVQGRIFNADGTASTNQFQIGTWAVDGSDDFDLENLSLAKLSNGNVVIGWVRSFASGNDEPVMAIINPTLAPTNPSFVVLGQTEIQQNDTTNIESPPIIKALADGKFIAVWSKNALNDGEPANKVVARIFNADGSAFTGDIQIGTWAVDGFNGYDNDNITVTQLTGGNIVVAYVRATGEVGGDEPVFTVISASGTTVRADVEMQQNDTTTYESPPVITALSDGRFMAVWVKNGADDNGLSLTMQGRIFNADGTPATNEFQVGTSPADGWDEYDTDNVVMTQLDNGNVVVGFVRNTSVANNDWPFFTIINPNIAPGQAGFTVAADVQINTTTTLSIGPPVIVSLPGSGGLFAVVRADVNGNSPIYARLYNGSGQPLTNEVLITTNANNQLSSNNGFDVSNLKMIALDQNSVAISWVGVNDGDGTGAYTSILHFNIRPVAANSAVTTNEDVPYVFTAANFNFSDADGDALASIRITSLENAGRLLLNGVDVTLNQVISRASIDAGLLTFVPASNANGVGYANFGYSVNDGLQDSVSSYTMTLNVTPVADLVANNDSATGTEDTAINSNVSLNDNTTSGGVLSYAVATAPSNGNLTFNADGTYSYQGNLDYNGLDSFTYTVTDAASGESLTRTVSLTITQVNDAGTFGGNLSGTGNEDTTITGTLTFADARDGYTTSNFALQTNGANGVASINGLGQWTYTPNANFNGVDSFTILTTDDDGNAETQIITINVQSLNDAPTSSDANISFSEDFNFVSALPAAFDLDGDAVTYSLFTQPSHGSVVVNANGSFSFSPTSNYNGADQFSFMINDGQGGTAVYLVSVTIDPVNDLPTTSTVTLSSMAEDTSRTITQTELLANATDVDGDALTVTSLQIASGSGSLSNNGNGTWTYTSAQDDDSSVTFTFTISDGQATTNGFSTLDITAVDDIVLPPDGGGGPGGGSGGDGSGSGGGSGGGSGSGEDKTQSKDDTSVQVLLDSLLNNNQTGKDTDSNSLSNKDNGEPVFELGDKIKKTVNEQNNSFATPIYRVNAGNDISLVSAKILGALSYGQGSNEGENSLVGGLKYDQKIAFAMNALEEQLNLKEFKVNFDTGAQVSTVVFSAGLMAWATQYTGLFASLFASLPAWSALDPMPILNKVNDDDEDEFDEDDDVSGYEDDDYDVNRVLS